MAGSMSQEELDSSLGPRISTTHSSKPSLDIELKGTHVTLTGLKQEEVPSLWKNLELPQNEALLTYLPIDPPSTPEQFSTTIDSLKNRGFYIYAIKGDPSRLSSTTSSTEASRSSNQHDQVLGMICYLDVQPANRALEIGAVMAGPGLQRTTAATEAFYLCIGHAFGETFGETPGISPPNRRVVWKCNTRNKASRRAAERLGFVYEGTFRNHIITKGRSRDSDWLSIVEEEWPAVRAGLQKWLDSANFDEHGHQVQRLEECRAATDTEA